jgi:prepilin-type N-terminal cleavage/methylation domain-containing protein
MPRSSASRPASGGGSAIPQRRAVFPQRGFSLIEVLVALAIVALVLVATAQVFGAGVLVHATANGTDTALALAEDKLAAAGVDAPLRSGISEGVFAGRYRWRRTVSRYADPESADLPEPPYRLYRVAVEVAWRDGWRERHAALATLRLGPAPP